MAYIDGSVADFPVSLTDWAAGSGHNGNTVAIAMGHRIRAGQGVDGPPVQPFAASGATDATKELPSITLPDDPRFEIYALTLQ